MGRVAHHKLTVDTTSKQAQTKARQEAIVEAGANYGVEKKLHALPLLLIDPELKKSPTSYLKGLATRAKKAEEAAKSLVVKGGN